MLNFVVNKHLKDQVLKSNTLSSYNVDIKKK